MFDARLILAGQPADPIGTARQLSDLFQSQQDASMRQAHEQRTLADLATQRQRGATLRDLLTKAGPQPQQRLAALQANPEFFKEAMGYESHVADVRAKNAVADRMPAGRDFLKDGLEQFSALFGDVKDDADYQTRLAVLDPRARAMLPPDYERGQRVIASILNSPKAQLQTSQAQLNTSRAAAFDRNGRPKPVDAAKQEADAVKLEAIRLRNETARRKLDAAGQSDELTALDGYEQKPGFKVKPEVAEKLRKAQAEKDMMTDNVDELMKLYHEHGNEVLPGQARARMQAVATHLQLAAKGESMFGLGVIAGPDMGLLTTVIPVPGKKDATIADFFSGGGDVSETMERLRVMREQVGKKFDATAASRGYRRRKGKGAVAGGGEPGADAWGDADEARLRELESKTAGAAP